MNSAGLTILFNTTGAALGPLLACFVLLPWLGFQIEPHLMRSVLCRAGYSRERKTTWSIRRPVGIALLALAAMLILIIATFPYNRDETHFANARRPYEGTVHT